MRNRCAARASNQPMRGVSFTTLVALLSLIALVPPVLGCAGDCDADGEVTVNELVTAINIALESSALTACAVVDASGDGSVTVNEVIAAVRSALHGCPQESTPTPTATPLAPTRTPTPTPDSPVAVPTSSSELRSWLEAGMYKGWTAESAPHPSAGPHGGTVRTYLNDLVLQSLAAGNASHPSGSALVKELYFGGSTVQLWAVEVKVQDDSDGGRGWYWWEGGISGLGNPTCTGCHAAGRDYVRTPFPLQ
jgi:hypothetical protein